MCARLVSSAKPVLEQHNRTNAKDPAWVRACACVFVLLLRRWPRPGQFYCQTVRRLYFGGPGTLFVSPRSLSLSLSPSLLPYRLLIGGPARPGVTDRPGPAPPPSLRPACWLLLRHPAGRDTKCIQCGRWEGGTGGRGDSSRAHRVCACVCVCLLCDLESLWAGFFNAPEVGGGGGSPPPPPPIYNMP